jgi:hypothetical protein
MKKINLAIFSLTTLIFRSNIIFQNGTSQLKDTVLQEYMKSSKTHKTAGSKSMHKIVFIVKPVTLKTLVET